MADSSCIWKGRDFRFLPGKTKPSYLKNHERCYALYRQLRLKCPGILLDRSITETSITAAAATRSAAGGLLSLLHLLRLLCVSLLQLLRLLLVSLLHLLRFRWRSLLSRQLLVFLVLFLLEMLPFLVLLRDYAFLLLLVFLVQLRIPRIGSSGAFDRRQVLGMGCEVGASESRQLAARRGSQKRVAGGHCGRTMHVESGRLQAQYVYHERQPLLEPWRAR